MTRWIRWTLAALATPVLCAAATSPQAAVDELLAADRAFSAASAKTDLVAGLSAMFADDVVIPMPPGQFVNGKAAVVEALNGNGDNATSRTEWTPVRGGISADAQHGFTFGYMTIHRADNTNLPLILDADSPIVVRRARSDAGHHLHERVIELRSVQE